MTDLGEITWILGMHITHDHHAGWIALSQEKYALKLLDRFGKSDTRPISMPTVTLSDYLYTFHTQTYLDCSFYLSILIHSSGVATITVLLHRDPCYHCTI